MNNIPNNNLLDQIKESKEKREKNQYTENPQVSVIIQSFNHADNINQLSENLRAADPDEIIICEDGSVDDSLDRWVACLQNPNDFIVRSNDLHELRSYDRAIGLARGEIVVLCQDDDIPPKTPAWIDLPLTLFARFPRLAIIGLKNARSGLTINPRKYYFSDKIIDVSTRVEGYDFSFVPMINLGPLFIRKKALIEMGGLDLSLSPPGWPAIHFDYELSLRAWEHGWQVGWLPIKGFTRSVGGSGTKVFGFASRRTEQARKNSAAVVSKYQEKFGNIELQVNRANQALSTG